MESVERVQLDLIALWKAKFLEHDETKTTNPIFNSKVSDFEEIIVKGDKYDVILRHNKSFQSQIQKRPSQFSEVAHSSEHIKAHESFSIRKEFDDSKFNFSKACQRENVAKYKAIDGVGTNVIKVNISPIFDTHMVLCPHMTNSLPQYISNADLLVEALKLFQLASCASQLFVGFNSCGAFSTINHLHFQLFDVSQISNIVCRRYSEAVKHTENFPIGNDDCQATFGFHEWEEQSLYRAFSIKLKGNQLSKFNLDQLRGLSNQLMTILEVLHERNQPYNLLIRDNVIHIIPRQFEGNVKASDEYGFGPAMVELFGVFIVKDPETWAKYKGQPEVLSEKLKCLTRDKVSLSEEAFNELLIEIINALKQIKQ